MSTLLLRFAGPMQAWGTGTRFDVCRTNREPTKSGVVGLLAAALGLRRDAPLDALTSLRFGVRVDREGVVLQDYHMVRGEKSAYVTRRYYLCDAVFLVGVSGEDEALMQRLDEAVRRPEDALTREPCLLPQNAGKRPEKVRMVLEDPDGPAKLADLPLSFSPFRREYGYRAARECWRDAPAAEHDPMRELR